MIRGFAKRLLYLYGLFTLGGGIAGLCVSLPAAIPTGSALAWTVLFVALVNVLIGGIIFRFTRHRKVKVEKLEVQVQGDGSVRVIIPKVLPDVGEFRSKLSAEMEQAEFRVWVSWPKRVPMNHEFAQTLHSLGNVIEGTGGYLWLSGVRPKDRMMIADHRGPKVDWID